ncbi:hypothetical protein ACFSJQ_23710 [Vibrio olivae]
MTNGGSLIGYLGIYSLASGCPVGTFENTSTGECIEPDEECTQDEYFDELTWSCQPTPYCERDSYLEDYALSRAQCSETGGVFESSCSNFLESYEFKCVDGSKCVFGAENWPSCLGDIDPTAPIDEPPSGFDGGTGNTANPNDPWEKDEPDTVTPTETTDTAVLDAIQNMNRDQNQALGKISSDMNQGFADTNTALNQLNSTSNAIGQSIIDQMNQDYELAKANRDAQNATTGAVLNAGSNIVDAIGTNGALVANAVGNNGDKLDAINGNLGEIKDLLSQGDELCEPTASNNYCENPHGLDLSTSSTIFSEMVGVVSAEYQEQERNLIASTEAQMNNAVSSAARENVEGSLSILTGALPQPGQCTALEFSLPFDKRAVITCEFSNNTKSILSAVFYMFTIYQLINILFATVTPVAGTVPYMRR